MHSPACGRRWGTGLWCRPAAAPAPAAGRGEALKSCDAVESACMRTADAEENSGSPSRKQPPHLRLPRVLDEVGVEPVAHHLRNDLLFEDAPALSSRRLLLAAAVEPPAPRALGRAGGRPLQLEHRGGVGWGPKVFCICLQDLLTHLSAYPSPGSGPEQQPHQHGHAVRTPLSAGMVNRRCVDLY